MRQLPPEASWRNHEAIQCLECGQWRAALGRHLIAAHGMTAGEYRSAWGMRQRQPLTAGYLSQVRREIAVATGGPDRLRELAPLAAPLAAAGRVGRERREQERRSLHQMQVAAAARSSARADSRAAAAARRLGDPDVGTYLRRRYRKERQPIRVLVADLGVSKEVVRRLMDQHGVTRRSVGPVPAPIQPDIPHGDNGYKNWRCRCDRCQAGNTESARVQRQRRVKRLAADPTLRPHGEEGTYGNWGCRCDPCCAAHSLAEQGRRRRRAAARAKVTTAPDVD